MSRTGIWVGLVALVLIVVVAPEANGKGGTPVTSCGQTVTTSSVLTQDLVCTGAGIVVGASGITIDLNGFSLRGDGDPLDYGIDDAAGYDGLTVKDGIVRNFDDGIRATGGADGVQVVEVVASGNASDGIIISGDSALVKSSTVDGNASAGIEIAGVDGEVKSSTASGNRGEGIIFFNGGRVTSSTTVGNGQGFLMEGVPTEIKSSTASGNVGSGIVVLADSASITSTTASANGGEGIVIAGNGPATLKDNHADGNGFAGGSGSDLSGLGIDVEFLTTPPKGTNSARGNDDPGECSPALLC